MDAHLAQVRSRLDEWAQRAGAQDEETWVRESRRELDASEPEDAGRYEQAGPLWQSYAGLRRYWEKRQAA